MTIKTISGDILCCDICGGNNDVFMTEKQHYYCGRYYNNGIDILLPYGGEHICKKCVNKFDEFLIFKKDIGKTVVTTKYIKLNEKNKKTFSLEHDENTMRTVFRETVIHSLEEIKKEKCTTKCF